MKKVSPLLAALAIIFMTSGCAGIKYLSVETHEPAQVTLPSNVQRIVVANNVVQQPDDVGHNYKPLGTSQIERVEASSDSVAIYYTEALAQFLDEEEYFQNVYYYNTPLREDTHFFQEQAILPETMSMILEETGADAIISLDRLIIETDVRDHLRQQGYTYAALTGRIHSVLRVYMPTMEGKIPVVQYQDSIRWEGFDFQDPDAYAEGMLPRREDAMKMLAVYAAEKMTQVFAPHWEMQDRWYYTAPGSLMREGEAFARAARWEDAIGKWEAHYTARSNKTEKAKAAHNVALAYEMIGNMEEAARWANTANELFLEQTGPKSLESRRSLIYKNELERRRDNSNRLNMQD